MNILSRQKEFNNKSYLAISVLGKSYKLDIKYRKNSIVEIDQKDNKIVLFLPNKYKIINNTSIINMAIAKMYDKIANQEIENSMEKARIILGFAPEDYRIARMSGTFYKCTKDRTIIINPDIMKYSRKIIDTTIIQAFCKVQYKPNTKKYQETLKKGIEKYENYTYFASESKKIYEEKVS